MARQSPQLESVDPRSLKPHPRNYRQHPEDQLQHLCRSLEEHGQYRNVVIAKDGTILAGHGVVAAALSLGWPEISVIRLGIKPDSRAALKILTGDNEIEHLAEQDDRALSELLREIGSDDLDELLGTGYDGMMLANLVMVTRPASEIQSFNEAAHWAGLPDYDVAGDQIKLIVTFDTLEDRVTYMEQYGFTKPSASLGKVWSVRWPERGKEDLLSLRYEAANA